jgi:hypothetical protein
MVSDIPEGAHWPPALPTLRDFVVSAGFAGAAVLLAAIIVFCAVLYASRRAARRLNEQLEQQERHHNQTREDQQRAAAIDRCWERLVWLVKTAGMEPAARDADEASLGLGPELALELLQGLLRDAKDLGDDTLASAVTVYLAQYGLVLGQRGPLPAVLAERDGHAASPADDKPSAAATAADEAPPATGEASAREGRHR